MKMVKGKPTFSIEELKEASADMQGFCLACGELADGVEPDAEGYTCEVCGKDQVMGAENIVLIHSELVA